MNRRFAALAVALTVTALPLAAQTPPGACVVNDASFTTREGGCQDQAGNLVWSSRQIGTWTWANTATWCGNLVEGGFSDWRVPTLAELQAVDTHGAAAHLHDITVNGQYFWSSTARGNRAWAHAFGTHADGLFIKTSFFYLYCVRPGLPAGGAGFVGSGALPQLRTARMLAGDTLTTTAIAPELAQRPCFFVAGLPGGTAMTIVQTVPGMIDAGPGMLNAAGRVSLSVDLGVAGLGLAEVQSFWLGLVVLEPTGPVLYDLSGGR